MSSNETNRDAWNELADGSAFARVATDEELAAPLLALDTRGWLPPRVDGLDVLCLAAAGGWQSILYAAAGARVTVADISPAMLALDRREASRRGVDVTCVEASMDALPLPAAAFDLVHQPVSTCYVARLQDVYAEVARLLRPGGLYISQHKNPASLQVTQTTRDAVTLGVAYDTHAPLPDRNTLGDAVNREAGCTEYLHRWHDLVGGLCRAGFNLEDLTEPHWAPRPGQRAAVGTMAHRARYVRPFVRLKARRRAPEPAPALWLPEETHT